MAIFSNIKDFSSRKLAAVSVVPLMMLASLPASAQQATWDTAALVKTITDGSAIVLALGTAILGVIVLKFGYGIARSMINKGS